MALWDEVVSRYADSELTQLTNQDDTNATTPNTTRANAAVTDVQAQFKILAGVEFDLTDARHVATGVECVVALLELRAKGGTTQQRQRWEECKTSLRELGAVTGRDRVSPVSSSELTPSDEASPGETVRPAFDDQQFRGIIADGPAARINAQTD